MANPMVITLDHFNTMQKNFQKHYFLANCNSDFGGQDIQVPWDSFALAVQNFIKTSGASPNTVAMRFVLCYDTANNALFLRMQICTMTTTSDPNTFNLDTTNCAWYTIEDGSLAPTAITDLFDQNYLDNFYYCDKGVCNPNTLVNLASDTSGTIFVRNLVFPWMQEIHKIYVNNSSPAGASIHFAAGSHDNTSPAVAHPHALAIYLCQSDGTPLLDNVNYGVEFQMKAGDFGTLCPPTCNVYILPK